MNRFAMQYLRNRDGRNPYGSMGGYVMPRRRGRDRAYENEGYGSGRYGDMEYTYQYNYPNEEYRDERMKMGKQPYREYDRNHMDYRNMNERYDEYDSRYDMEYNEYDSMRLNNRELKKWKKELENADGSRGEKFHIEQILPMAQQLGIQFRDFTEEEFCMTVNMLYSDYCKELGSDLGIYIKLAKAFLNDDDFEGTGSEKLALYYKCIVEAGE